MFKGKTIFFSALDWGLGHASRSVPLIRELTNTNTVVLGVSPSQKTFYDRYFPGLEQVSLPSYRVFYSRFFPAWLKVFFQSPLLYFKIKQEHRLIQNLVKTRKFDVLLSDNRYGVYSDKINSILICHQLTMVAPFFGALINKLHRRLISRFSEVWVPDYEGDADCLAGKLSRVDKFPVPLKYIGPQSALATSTSGEKRECDYLLLLSGPEPTRSEFEKILRDTFRNSGKKVTLVRGTTGATPVQHDGLECYDFLSGETLAAFVAGAGTVICRSGYSTLMDLHVLKKKKIILIPTPGQPEQEYLAKYWHAKFGAKVCKQSKIDSLC